LKQEQNTPLHIAAKIDNQKVLKRLLDNGADIWALNDENMILIRIKLHLPLLQQIAYPIIVY